VTPPDPMPWSGVVDRVEAICLALPEATMRSEAWGRLFNIRRNTFCFLTARATPERTYVPLVVLRTDPEERKVLLEIGPPYFDSRGGFGRIEVLLDDDTDWEEIRELVTESYRTLAPKKLIARLDDMPATAETADLDAAPPGQRLPGSEDDIGQRDDGKADE
jgi:hypothetical protein